MNLMTLAAKLDRIVQAQLPTRSAFGVSSTGPLEQFYRELKNNIGDRASRMTNKRRADALLMLLAARSNRWGSEQDWAELIRKHFTSARASLASSGSTRIEDRTQPACPSGPVLARRAP